MPIDSTRFCPQQLLAAALRPEEARPDRELLARFAATREEAAFAEIVRRHGRLVFSVARRVTACREDAEDAFQAAFLVLARRAGQLTKPDLLANWLYGVAYRTALEARNARRRILEQPLVSAATEPPDHRRTDSPDDADLRRVVDEELAALPEKFRACVVLCDLEGISRKDAAAQLGIPEGTLSSRLNHARNLLAVRLSRRGVSASGAALGAFLTRDALGAVIPPALAQHTVRAAGRFAVGGPLAPEFASSQVASLTEGVLHAMILTRTRLWLGAVTLGLLGFGAAAGLGQFPGQSQYAQPSIPLNSADASLQPAAAAPPEKVPAKGIEDDDVPYPAAPIQAVVRLEDSGKLMIRQRVRHYVQVEKTGAKNAKVVVNEVQTIVAGRPVDAADVSVFDMKGNRVPEKVWREKLKTDKLVLISMDGRLPPPRDLQLVKEDTLLLVFPPGVAGHDPFWSPASPYRIRQGAYGLYTEPDVYAIPPATAPTAPIPSSNVPTQPATPQSGSTVPRPN